MSFAVQCCEQHTCLPATARSIEPTASKHHTSEVEMRGPDFSLLLSPEGSVTKSFIRTSSVIVPASLLNEFFFSEKKGGREVEL
jgi:hypothetical protein